MKYQALFTLKDKSKKLKCRLLQILFGALGLRFNGLRYESLGSRLCQVFPHVLTCSFYLPHKPRDAKTLIFGRYCCKMVCVVCIIC